MPYDYARTRERKLEILRAYLRDVRPDPSLAALTPAMMKRYHRISSRKEWVKVQCLFHADIREYGVLSYDTETFISVDCGGPAEDHGERALIHGLEGLLIGTFNNVFDFDVPALLKAAKRRGDYRESDLNTVLPADLCDALAHPAYPKLGSNVAPDAASDLQAFNLKVKPVYEVQYIHEDCGSLSPTYLSPLEGGAEQGHGLGRLSMDVHGADYKPMKATRYRKKYSGFQGINPRRPAAWSAFTYPPDLYQWSKPLSGYAQLYRFLDASVPMALLAWIGVKLLETNKMSRAAAGENMMEMLHRIASSGEAQAVQKISKKERIEYFASERCDPAAVFLAGALCDVGVDTQGSREKEVQQYESGCPEEVARPEGGAVVSCVVTDGAEQREGDRDEAESDEDEMFYEFSHSNDAKITQADVEIMEEEQNDNETDLSSYHRFKVGVRKRIGPQTHFHGIKKKDKPKLGFKLRPLPFNKCSFCSSSTHSRRSKDGRPLCRFFRDQLNRILAGEDARELCSYPLCGFKIGHLKQACPTLAGRCRKCKLRGHRSSRCRADDQGLEELRAVFEAHADSHYFLKQRYANPEWGFHSVNVYTPKATVKYNELLSMSAREAENHLARLNQSTKFEDTSPTLLSPPTASSLAASALSSAPTCSR